jgi:hypothetical protein
VASCGRAIGKQVTVRTLDLDLIAEWDEWLVVVPFSDGEIEAAQERLSTDPGTVVIWRELDRVLPEKRPDGTHSVHAKSEHSAMAYSTPCPRRDRGRADHTYQRHYASSMAMLESARRSVWVPVLKRVAGTDG